MVASSSTSVLKLDGGGAIITLSFSDLTEKSLGMPLVFDEEGSEPVVATIAMVDGGMALVVSMPPTMLVGLTG